MKDEEKTRKPSFPQAFGANRSHIGGKESFNNFESSKEDPMTAALPKILVVDDSPFVLNLLNSALTRNGFKVFTASDGKSALRFVTDERPDIILLDIIMPVMDGYEVCRILKSDEKNRLIPVIFVSALEEETDKLDGFKAGGVDYITKPFQMPELLARINVHLELQRLQAILKKQNEERQQYTQKLEDLNVTLKVLLSKREEDSLALEEKITSNIKHLLMPNLEMLKKRNSDPECKALIEMIESNLLKITSTFSYKLSSKYFSLTPTEIKVANLVKDGRQTKEIAEILAVSTSSIELHRFNIRKKLGLKSRKANLQSHLSSIS